MTEERPKLWGVSKSSLARTQFGIDLTLSSILQERCSDASAKRKDRSRVPINIRFRQMRL